MTREYVEEVYEKLHSMPEIAFQEFKTSKYILKQLESLNFDTVKVGETGIIATLDSGIPGPVFGIRTDIDALRFSINDKIVNIHACGHDANASMVLATAKEISEETISKGKLILIFQPAEEADGGAKFMIQYGNLEELEELVGIHLRPIAEAALGEASPALCHGACNTIGVIIKGSSSHGARPHLGINSIDVAISAINAVNAVKVDPRVSHSIKVTQINSDESAQNIIPATTKFILDVRAQTNTVMDELVNKSIKAIEGISNAYGATVSFSDDYVPAADYSEETLDMVAESIKKVLGKVLPNMITPGSEDFHFYMKKLKVKTAYIGLGADLKPGLHKPEMSFNLKALTHGKEILKDIVHNRLG